MERPARQALTPRFGAYVQLVLLGGMVASAQRLLCSTSLDEWDARGCRGTRDQLKFRNGARSFKEQQRKAIVL